MGKYATFSGRASRSEYWWFALFGMIISWAASITGGIIDPVFGSVLSTLISLALFLPSLGASVRRLHDVGRSGWWLLLYLTIIGIFVVLYWLASSPETQDNQYGPYQEPGSLDSGQGASSNSDLDKLQKLYELKERGVISEADFQKQKSKLI
jgi:uncharacterized membrane protein YhaH (DUF805 family)